MKSKKASKKSTTKRKVAKRRTTKSTQGTRAKAKPKTAVKRGRATGRKGGAKAPVRTPRRSSSRRPGQAGSVRPAIAPEPVLQPAATLPAALTVHEALRIAIDFEHKVRDHYAKGAVAIQDPQGRKVFAALAKEEQGHVDFLESRLALWSTTGSTGGERLTSTLPPPAWVREAQARHRATASLRRVADQNEVELLKIALKLEQEASSFYHDLVRRLSAGDRDLFEPFLTIEDGHLTLVQAELDAVQGWGYWFDVPEFALEAQ